MAIRDNVYGSKLEKRNYDKLCRVWNPEYNIVHNLPFLSVLSTKDLLEFTDYKNPVPIIISPEEVAKLKKTSIDYTLCDKNDRPILCIEFDGLQEGFSVGTDYYAGKNIGKKSPWRREITELKLKVAHGSNLPFFVVGSKEFADINSKVKLTIVDGIIGEVIATRETSIRFSKGFDPQEIGYSEDQFEKLPASERHELIQNWAIGVEVDAQLDNNPIAKERAMLDYKLGVTSFSVHPMEYPAPVFDKGLHERIVGYNHAILFGSRVILHTKDHGDISGEVWLPNFNAPSFSPHGLTEEIAALFALLKLRKVMKRRPTRG